MAFIYIVQLLGKKGQFWSWRFWHWAIKTLHIWFLCDWLIKCKQTLFLTSVYWLLWLGRRRFRSGLDRNEGDVSVSHSSVAGWAVSSPFASLCWLISFQREGTWLFNTLHASTPCSQLVSNLTLQNFPSVAATAHHGRQSWVSPCRRTVPPWKAHQGGVGKSMQSSRKISGPPRLIPPTSLPNSAGTWSRQGLLQLLSFAHMRHEHRWGLSWEELPQSMRMLVGSTWQKVTLTGWGQQGVSACR